jgi:hypothetical protein
VAFHYPLIKPHKPIVILYDFVIPGKKNTTILALVALFIVLNAPFYTLRKTASPAPFLEAIVKN